MIELALITRHLTYFSVTKASSDFKSFFLKLSAFAKHHYQSKILATGKFKKIEQEIFMYCRKCLLFF